MTGPAPADRTQTAAAAEKAEAAAARRRWINLGEFVAVVGLIIAAASLWLAWNDRKTDEADRQAEKSIEARDRARYVVRSSMRGNDIAITADDRHQLGDISVAFPASLGLSPQTSATQTIPGGWYEGALLKATDGGPDAQSGKLPILLTVGYIDDDKLLSTTGVFDIVWRTNGRGLLGRGLHIVAMRPHERGGSQARIDQLWKAERSN